MHHKSFCFVFCMRTIISYFVFYSPRGGEGRGAVFIGAPIPRLIYSALVVLWASAIYQ